MFKKMFTLGVLLVIAIAAVLVSPNIGQAQRYLGGGYGMYRSYYQPSYGNYGPYYGYQRLYVPSFSLLVILPSVLRRLLRLWVSRLLRCVSRYGYYPNYMWR